MIRIANSREAFAAIERTLPLGTVAVEPKVNAQGEREIWLDEGVLNRVRLLRGPSARRAFRARGRSRFRV